ncbi:MAG: anchored repeat-type ABC transporter permease subunit [Pseudonocardiaceae bacterium]
MIELLELVTQPWSETFMQRAFLVGAAAAVACAVVGTFVVLRGMAFIGDAVAHAVFPGVAIGFVLQISLVLGGLVTGILTAIAIFFASRSRRLSEDSAIGVFFAFSFALGIVVVSTQQAYTGDLTSFLFGQILGVSDDDVLMVLIVGATLVALTLAVQRRLVTVTLDRETAAALGLRVARWDLLVYLLVTIAIVISLQAVGNILVLALLITPAAAARLVTDRLGVMMAIAAAIGAVSAIVGLYLSYYYNLAAGGLIVMVLTAAFLACWAGRTLRAARWWAPAAALPEEPDEQLLAGSLGRVP